MESFQFTFEAIGTKWIIDIIDAPPEIDLTEIDNAITKRVAEFDLVYSRFRTDSLINMMSKRKGTYTVPEDAKPLLELYYNMYRITDGAFTPLIGKVLEEAGYDKAYSLQMQTLHHPPSWDDMIIYNHPTLKLIKPVVLDFGAAGKGYLVDIIGELLTREKINSFCIDAGGDILHRNSNIKKLRIGMEHPDNTEQVIGIATIVNQAICGSSGNRRKWGDFHHIIDPHTLTSPRTVLATWVIAETTMLADALATCLFFTKPKVLQRHYDFEYFRLLSDYSSDKSFAFPAEIFYNDQDS